MSSRGRIPVSGPREALQTPFAGLDIPDLPEGVGPEENKETRKAPGRVVLRKEKSHRGGKSVIVVSGFQPAFSDGEIEGIARKARKQCGCGGTVANREIELQGDDPARIRSFFVAAGFRVDGI